MIKIYEILLENGYNPFPNFEDLSRYYGIDVSELLRFDSLDNRPTEIATHHSFPIKVESDMHHNAMVTGEWCNERKRSVM